MSLPEGIAGGIVAGVFMLGAKLFDWWSTRRKADADVDVTRSADNREWAKLFQEELDKTRKELVEARTKHQELADRIDTIEAAHRVEIKRLEDERDEALLQVSSQRAQIQALEQRVAELERRNSGE